MKYPKIIETLTQTPLLITPGAAESYMTLLDQHATLSGDAFKMAREGTGPCGENVELEQMTVGDNGIANIPIGGPLGVGLGSFEKGAGAVDYMDIIADIKAANKDPKVNAILLHFDTPGGMFGGLLETARAIENSEKPIYSYVPMGGSCCSAGMWLAAASQGIFVSPSATIGSIGVYCAYMDMTGAAEKRGIKVRVFSSGKFKGMGVPGTSLTDEQAMFLQDRVLKMADDFYEHIRETRGDVPDDAMQGQTFGAKEAIEVGLADEIVQDLDELYGYLG